MPSYKPTSTQFHLIGLTPDQPLLSHCGLSIQYSIKHTQFIFTVFHALPGVTVLTVYWLIRCRLPGCTTSPPPEIVQMALGTWFALIFFFPPCYLTHRIYHLLITSLQTLAIYQIHPEPFQLCLNCTHART